MGRLPILIWIIEEKTQILQTASKLHVDGRSCSASHDNNSQPMLSNTVQSVKTRATDPECLMQVLNSMTTVHKNFSKGIFLVSTKQPFIC